MKYCIGKFFNFSYKSIIRDKIILFDETLLVQKKKKNTMQAGYAERTINPFVPMHPFCSP